MREPRREDPTESFGPYLIFECLGRGGMATVHRAKQTGIEGFERPVALKRMLPWLTSDVEFVKSFVREARLAALLRHTNIVQTYDLGKVDGTYYIAMELVGGRDLRELLRHSHNVVGPPPSPVTINILFQVCDALDYAHGFRDEQGRPLGLVHRDISPANVLVADDGTAKIVDFGVAKGSTATLATMSGMLKGKFAYMAPEMLQGQVDARCDLFAIGVVAWELLTARPLFAGGDDMEILQRVTTWDPPAPSSINPKVPRELDAWVEMALAKNPQRRFQSAAQMRAGLELVARTPAMRATAADVATWMNWAFAQKPGGRPTGAPQIPAPPPPPMAMPMPTPARSIPAMPGPSALGIGPIGGADSVAITLDDSTNIRPIPAPAAAASMTAPAGARTMMLDESAVIQDDPLTPIGAVPPPGMRPGASQPPPVGAPAPVAAPPRPMTGARLAPVQHATMIGTAIPASVAAAAAAAQHRGSSTAPPPVIAPGTLPPGAAGAGQRTVLFDGAPPALAGARSQPGMALPAMPPGASAESLPAPAGTPTPSSQGYQPPYAPAAGYGQAGGYPPSGHQVSAIAEPPLAATSNLPAWGAGTPGGQSGQDPYGGHGGGPVGGFTPASHQDGPIGRGPGFGAGPPTDLPVPRPRGGNGLLIMMVLVLCAGAALVGYLLIQRYG